ncbi:MAG: site-specific integrase [Acidobacteriota bacterium]
MALKRRGKNGVWWAFFKVGGRRFRFSTGFTDKLLAQAREAEVWKQRRFELLGWTEHEKARAQSLTFQEWADKYEKTHTVRKAPRTQERDRDMLANLRRFFAAKRLDEIAKSDCIGYVNWRKAQGNQNPSYKSAMSAGRKKPTRALAEGTVTREVCFAQAVFQAAVDDEIIQSNPWRKVPRERYRARDRVITAEEQTRIEARLSLRFVRFLRFLLGTGLRLDEARLLEPGDIDFARHVVRVTGKGDRERDVPLAPDVEDTLRDQLADDGRLWHQNPQRLREVLSTAARRAGVPPVSPHTCRHTFATRYIKRGGDIYTLSRILGHASVSVTERVYAHPDSDDLVALSRLVLPGIATGGDTKGATRVKARR